MFYSLTRRTHNVKQQNSGTRTLNTLAKAPFPSGFSTLKSFIDILTGTVRKHAYTAGTRKNDYYDTTLAITGRHFCNEFFCRKENFCSIFLNFLYQKQRKISILKLRRSEKPPPQNLEGPLQPLRTSSQQTTSDCRRAYAEVQTKASAPHTQTGQG